MQWKVAQTDEEKERCYRLRSLEYGKRYREIPPLFKDHFDDARLPDGTPQAQTIYIETGEQMIATARITLAIHPNYPDIGCEIFWLMAPKATIEAQLNKHVMPPPGIVVEMGKFTVSRAAGDSFEAVLRLLISGVLTISQRMGADTFIAIIPPRVVRAISRTNVPLNRISNITFNRDDPQVLRLLVEHYDYFLPALVERAPQVASMTIDDQTDHNDLLRLTEGIEDGAYLHWGRISSHFSEIVS